MYGINQNYFKVIDNKRKAYWLGFLYADGCINEYRNKATGKLKAMSLEVTLKHSDKNHLYKLLNDLESNAPIKERKTRIKDKEYRSNRITICNTNLCRDLIALGCTPRKSLTIKFPNEDIVPSELIHHFIRGYFDGDGTVGIYYLKNYSRYNYRYGFVGTKDMLDGIQSYFKRYGFNKTSYQRTGKVYQFLYGNRGRMIKFKEILYKNSTIHLERKYDVFTNLPTIPAMG